MKLNPFSFKHIPLFMGMCFFSSLAQAQDTFSICAVDTATGEVGSAGASCIDATVIAGGCVIISDVHPGVGVIHTQSYWNPSNQSYANSLMSMGLSPQQIIDSLVVNDAQGDSTVRQYGIVDFTVNGPRAAAFTGSNCFAYKNHIIGPCYAIQGNILLGQQILDSMEARFLNTPGDLACRLMAAMHGAKVIGADTRCTSSGNSSLSSFLRVACPTDIAPNFSLDLVVPQGPAGFEPIDSLQTLFNAAHNCGSPMNCSVGIGESRNAEDIGVKVFPNPVPGGAGFRVTSEISGIKWIRIFSPEGKMIFEKKPAGNKSYYLEEGILSPGIYFFNVETESGGMKNAKLVVLE